MPHLNKIAIQFFYGLIILAALRWAADARLNAADTCFSRAANSLKRKLTHSLHKSVILDHYDKSLLKAISNFARASRKNQHLKHLMTIRQNKSILALQ